MGRKEETGNIREYFEGYWAWNSKDCWEE